MLSEVKTNKFFDQSDMQFCREYNKETPFTEVIKSHTLLYVYSGELTICENENILRVKAHECVFLKKGSVVTSCIHPENNDGFKATYIRLRKCVLKDFFKELHNKERFTDGISLCSNIDKVPCTPDIQSLFYSIIPYYKDNTLPTPIITNLKIKAGIFSLLNLYTGFYAILFDFRGKWNFPWTDCL
jgi:hypothetical protein